MRVLDQIVIEIGENWEIYVIYSRPWPCKAIGGKSCISGVSFD